MKKRTVATLVGALCATSTLLLTTTGCNRATGVRAGYGFVAPGMIYSQTAQGGEIEPNLEILKRPYKHLGKTTGEATSTNVLLIVGAGDASISKAQNDALMKVQGADAIINRVFDVKSFSILGLFTTTTLVVSGDAIQFTDSAQSAAK